MSRPRPRRPTGWWHRSPALASSQQGRRAVLFPSRSGTRPRIGSRIENRASSVTTRRSQASASWKPAPTAEPRTAAIAMISGRRSQVKPSCQVAMLVGHLAVGHVQHLQHRGLAVEAVGARASGGRGRRRTCRRHPHDDHADAGSRATRPMIRSACQVAGVCEFLRRRTVQRDGRDQAVLLERSGRRARRTSGSNAAALHAGSAAGRQASATRSA